MSYYTALVTLASVLFYAYTSFRVAHARGQYDVAAPATTGHPIFERLYRVQIEHAGMDGYLPPLSVAVRSLCFRRRAGLVGPVVDSGSHPLYAGL